MSFEDKLIQFIDRVVCWRRQREVMRIKRRRCGKREVNRAISPLTSHRRNQVMRILANYGYKTNGDTYTVTFETIGDVPAAQATQTVDELFRLAKEAVQRQLAGVKLSPQPAAEATTQPPVQPRVFVNGNGNGKRPQIRQPGLPATSKQLGLIRRLATLKGREVEDFTDMTKGEASQKIEELMAV